MQRRLRQIGDVSAHARDGQSFGRSPALFQVAAGAPFRIGHHGLAADLVEGDILGRMPRAGCDRQGGEDTLGIARAPLQHLHAAHGAAEHAEQAVDAEPVEQHGLGAHHVADRDEREIHRPRPAGRRIGRGRAGRAHAAADDIGADNEEPPRIDRLAGADHGLPPAGLARDRVDVGDVLVAGQRVADENGVGAVGVELAIGLVGDLPGSQRGARIEGERLVRAEARHRARRLVGLSQALGGYFGDMVHRGQVHMGRLGPGRQSGLPRTSIPVDEPSLSAAGFLNRRHSPMKQAPYSALGQPGSARRHD